MKAKIPSFAKGIGMTWTTCSQYSIPACFFSHVHGRSLFAHSRHHSLSTAPGSPFRSPAPSFVPEISPLQAFSACPDR
jgi:hypothetical protein